MARPKRLGRGERVAVKAVQEVWRSERSLDGDRRDLERTSAHHALKITVSILLDAHVDHQGDGGGRRRPSVSLGTQNVNVVPSAGA